jgi:large conductance mechanosensitive channel
MGFFSDFKGFVLRGNVVDLAVGVIIGAAFGGVTKSMVDDVLMPPLGLAMGAVDFKDQYIPLIVRPEAMKKYDELKSDLLKEEEEKVKAQNLILAKDQKPLLPIPTSVSPTLDQAVAKGVPTLRYGLFLNTVINFVFVAFGVFLIVKLMMVLQRSKPPPPPAPAEPTPSEKLLAEIRDTLKAQKAR